MHLRREETHRAGLEEAFRRDRGFLRALLYRMTGVGADADDLLQETFRRAWERPPLDPDRPLRPWLTTVAMNLARDHLRQRRRQPYIGPWLPGIDPEAATTELSASARYDQKESASLAFLLALEALTPGARRRGSGALLRYEYRPTRKDTGMDTKKCIVLPVRLRKTVAGSPGGSVVTPSTTAPLIAAWRRFSRI